MSLGGKGMSGAAAATVAAVIASAGDGFLLAVASGALPGGAPLLVGHYLGVLAIPFYAFGYLAVSRRLRAAGPRAAEIVLVSGALAAAFGSAIHGVTAIAVGSEATAIVAGGDPVAVLAPWTAFLLPLWLVVGALALVGSIVFVLAVLGGGTDYPRGFVLFNPALLTVAIAALAASWSAGTAWVAPAAPNLAHVLFFGAVAAFEWSRD